MPSHISFYPNQRFCRTFPSPLTPVSFCEKKVQSLDENFLHACVYIYIVTKLFRESGTNLLQCSSHRSISFRESIPSLRDSVTHWPINWQSALIPSSSQELFFLVPFCRTGKVREPWTSSRNRSLSHDCHWFHLEPLAEENAAASFAHASYKPRTNILTSDTKGTLTPLRLLL